MYRTILVPLGGSSFAELALPMAVALARLMSAKLVLVRAAGGPIPTDESPAQAEAEAEWEAERYLTRVARQLSGQGVPVETATPYLPPCEGILHESKTQHADLIVMCTHARSGVETWRFGSVAEGVLSRSTVPVLLLRPEDASPRPPVLKESCILVPLDGSAFGESALPYACTMAQVLNTKIVLLRVIPIPLFSMVLTDGLSAMEQRLNMEQADAGQYLAQVAQRLTETGLNVETRTCSGGAVSGIVEQGETTHASMIVITPHGRIGMNELIMGSVARGVMEWSSRPLLLVPPRQAPDL